MPVILKSMLTKSASGAAVVILSLSFFTPFSESFIFKKYDRLPWERQVKKLRYVNKWLYPPFIALGEMTGMIEHFPQLAGELLLSIYNNDPEKVIKEHQDIIKINGQDLWKDYCLPLLKDGKI